MSIHRLTVLEALWFQQKTGCTLRSLQDRLYLPKQTIHTIVDGLVKEGYLERLPSPEDKRTKVLRPVSYTHLDVYKRQTVTVPQLTCVTCSISSAQAWAQPAVSAGSSTRRAL